jgi:hypothetical protein
LTYSWVGPDGTQRTLIQAASPNGHLFKSNDSTNIEFNRTTRVLKLANGM